MEAIVGVLADHMLTVALRDWYEEFPATRVRLVSGPGEPVVLELDDERACFSCSPHEVSDCRQEPGRRWDCLVP
jgi:hypothetical protein